MEPENKYRHGKAKRQAKSFRLPGELVDRLKREPNQTAVIVKALEEYYMREHND